MKSMLRLFVILFIFLSAGLIDASIPPANPFRVSWDAEPVKLAPGSHFDLSVTIRVPESYYLYADETDVDFSALEGLLIKNIIYPEAIRFEDPFLGRIVDIYKGDITIKISGDVPERLDVGEHELVANVHYRGCSPPICYRPQERVVSFLMNVEAGAPELADASKDSAENTGAGAAKEGEGEELRFKELLRITDFGELVGRGIALTILIVFFAGVLTSLTPCVWPVMPAVLLFVGVHPHKKFRENILLAASLVAGLSLVYSVLGLLAAALGKNLGFLFQHKWFLALVVLFFVAMALSMFGAFDLRLPMRWQRRMHNLGGEGYRGSFLAGLGLGLVASPCAGPILAALLGYVVLQRSFAFGFVLLIVYSLGMGLLFIILGACYGELTVKLRGGPWLVWVKRALGVALLFPAAFYMGSLFHWSGEGAGDRAKVAWIVSQKDAFEFAKQNKRPIMMQFTADWCPPCHTLNDRFFTRSDIVRMTYQMVPLKIDATVETKRVRRIIDKYKVIGWPTVIFLDPKGKPYKDLRVNSYDPRAIERSIGEVINRASADNK